MPQLSSWLRAVLRWLAEPRLVWITLFVIILAFVVALRPGASDFQIRVTGLVLQWLGIGTVAHGVHQTRQLFGLPSIMTSIRRWLSHFPRWRGRVIAMTGTGSLGLSGGTARLEVWSTVDPAAPVDARIQALTSNVDRLKDRISQLHNEMDTRLREHSEALRQEQGVRAKDDEHLRTRLEAAETGGLQITFAGVIWLFLGVLLATLSPEISGWRS